MAKLYIFTAIARQRPHPSSDLLGLYDLRSVQISVQRKDPVTGEKVNKLRKSYEGKLKDLGLEGRNKATESEGYLQGFVDPAWDDAVFDGSGKTIWQARMEPTAIGGSTQETLLKGLDAALTFKSGRLPKAEHNQWTHSLGLGETVAAKAAPVAPAVPAKTQTTNFVSKVAPIANGRSSAPASPQSLAGRMQRKGAKRRYDESTYEGYDEDGYSTGGDRAGKRRKQQVRN
jgi:hypothetical protein